MPPSAYDVLGLTPAASDEEVRRAYLALARKHHPDKQGDEATFKSVNDAYRSILEARQRGGAPLGGLDTASLDDWVQMFAKLRDRVMEKAAARKAHREAAQAMHADAHGPHRVTLVVTLEEVQARRQRKVMMTLKGCAAAVYVDVDCGAFPLFKCPAVLGKHRDIEVHMQFAPHPVYETDDSIDGVTWDLFYDVPLKLSDYFTGGTVDVPRLDGTPYDTRAYPAFFDAAGRYLMTIRDDALWRLGSVIVSYRLVLPTAAAWVAAGAPPDFLATLERLETKST